MSKSRPVTWLLDAIALIALGVPVIRYALAFSQAEPPLRLWNGITWDVSPVTGLLFGLSFEAAVYMGLREAFAARSRKTIYWWLPLLGVALQVIAGVGIVAPVVEGQVTGQSLPAVLGSWSWAWSIVLTGATLLTFSTVALARALRKEDPVTGRKGKDSTQGENAERNGNATVAHTETAPSAAQDSPAMKAAFAVWDTQPDAANEEVAVKIARSLRSVQNYRKTYAQRRNGGMQP